LKKEMRFSNGTFFFDSKAKIEKESFPSLLKVWEFSKISTLQDCDARDSKRLSTEVPCRLSNHCPAESTATRLFLVQTPPTSLHLHLKIARAITHPNYFLSFQLSFFQSSSVPFMIIEKTQDSQFKKLF